MMCPCVYLFFFLQVVVKKVSLTKTNNKLFTLLFISLKMWKTQKWKCAVNLHPQAIQDTGDFFFSRTVKKIFSLVILEMQVSEKHIKEHKINTRGSWRYIEVSWSETISLCKKPNIIYNIIYTIFLPISWIAWGRIN